MNYLVSGNEPQRMGNAHPNIVPYQALATADGHIVLTVGNDSQFGKFCVLAGKPELAVDERFASNADRVENRSVLLPILELLLKQRCSADWISMLEEAGVPCGPINSLAEVFSDPQVEAREMRIEIENQRGGKVALVGSPMKFSQSPVEYNLAPPLLGEHNREILGEMLGLSKQELLNLAEKGVIGASPSAKESCDTLDQTCSTL
jgi:crotonobetainyl-CoA:carnitine CoA-transferase CaiB-like acyl-CoA transferase